jgi:NTP pyrophosphatase (non-canonical NTP hydrolase)
MALLGLDDQAVLATHDRLSVVVCGSYHRDRDGLLRAVAMLEQSFEVVSPRSFDFVDQSAEFVRLPGEQAESERDIEARHLAAMRGADLVWLHAPDGYVGTSGALELGHAMALGIPVFCVTPPTDPVLAAAVVTVATPGDVELGILEEVGAPGRGLDRLQRYYRRAASRRGWETESPRDTLLLLTEELGELARAVRKLEGLDRSHAPEGVGDVGEELADVQLYVIHLANALGLELAGAVTSKELVNARRSGRSRDAA